MPASSSSLLVVGEFQVICWMSSGEPSPVPAASGDVVALPPEIHEVCVFWRSQKRPILLRGEACHVNRRCLLPHVPSSFAGRFGSAAYVHFVGSPALTLKNMPATCLRLP